MPTESACAKITLTLFVAVVPGGCAPSAPPLRIASDDQACERTMTVLAANGTYRAERMAGCWNGNSDENPGLYVLRVNGHCREPDFCGSVLMGWYGVAAATGAVYEWDFGEWQPGARIDRNE